MATIRDEIGEESRPEGQLLELTARQTTAKTTARGHMKGHLLV